MALSYEDFFVHLPLVAVDSTIQRVGFYLQQHVVPTQASKYCSQSPGDHPWTHRWFLSYRLDISMSGSTLCFFAFFFLCFLIINYTAPLWIWNSYTRFMLSLVSSLHWAWTRFRFCGAAGVNFVKTIRRRGIIAANITALDHVSRVRGGTEPRCEYVSAYGMCSE